MDWANSWIELRGSKLLLRPTVADDAAGLARCTDETTFIHSLGRPATSSPEAMEEFLTAKTSKPYTIIVAETGEIVGCSSFMDQRESHRAVEIGGTWIAPKWRGTFVNPEAKCLMLRHGFENLGCVRVQLKCDARNERSAAAILKLGAKFEGRLRNYGILPDGFVRDTLMFSILDSEWPEVRQRLENRLVGLT